MEDIQGHGTNILGSLDPQIVQALKASEKNWNNDFIEGNDTSVFQDNPSGAIQSALNNTTNSLQLVNLAPQLTTYVTSYVTGIVMSYLQESIVDILSINPNKIMSLASSKMGQYIMGPGQIMAELLKPIEATSELNYQNSLNNQIGAINTEINKQIGNITDSINKHLSKITPIVTDIAKYTGMGPNWVSTKLESSITSICSQCFKSIAEKRDSTKRQVQKAIDDVANGFAKKQAEDINTQTKRQMKDTNDKVEKNKQKAITKAKTAVTNAKLKLMALVGG